MSSETRLFETSVLRCPRRAAGKVRMTGTRIWRSPQPRLRFWKHSRLTRTNKRGASAKTGGPRLRLMTPVEIGQSTVWKQLRSAISSRDSRMRGFTRKPMTNMAWSIRTSYRRQPMARFRHPLSFANILPPDCASLSARRRFGSLALHELASTPGYLIYGVGLVAFAVRPALAAHSPRAALLYGALFGLCAYRRSIRFPSWRKVAVSPPGIVMVALTR
jgi:Predicted membrane protein (DUF2177)